MRDHGVRIGGSTYIPLENPQKLMKQLTLICEKAEKIKNPHEKSLFLLAHIAYLQAFTDINKRTSRLSANIPLIQNNLVSLSFNDVEKDEYASAMIAIYEFNKISPLLEIYIHSYLRTCQLYDTTVEAIGFDEIRVRYRRRRREIIRYVVERKLTGKKLINYIHAQAASSVEADQQADFLDDLNEDLKLISPQRIVGLGITLQQLNEWLSLQKKSKS